MDEEMVGKRVRFLTGSELPGATGTVIEAYDLPSAWVVRLDQGWPGFYSGTAWGYRDEMEVLDGQ